MPTDELRKEFEARAHAWLRHADRGLLQMDYESDGDDLDYHNHDVESLLADFAMQEAQAATQKAAELFSKLQAAERFVESAREHFEDPETTHCVGCTKALIGYDVLSSKPIEEIRAELKKRQQ